MIFYFTILCLIIFIVCLNNILYNRHETLWIIKDNLITDIHNNDTRKLFGNYYLTFQKSDLYRPHTRKHHIVHKGIGNLIL